MNIYKFNLMSRYTLLVGRPPFETSCLKDTYMRIRNNEYAIPSKVSRPAAKLIQKFLSERPQDRPRLDTVINDEFFTRGFFPRTLPSICCVAPPKFASLRNRNISSARRKPLRTQNGKQLEVREQVNNVVKDAFAKITLRDKTDGTDDERHHESGFDSQESYPTNGEERVTDEEGNKHFYRRYLIRICNYHYSFVIQIQFN